MGVSRLIVGASSPLQASVRAVGRGALLGIHEAAEPPKVWTATVSSCVPEGALEHVRVLNSIRVSEATLRAFITTHS
jgi:hypothetical protein